MIKSLFRQIVISVILIFCVLQTRALNQPVVNVDSLLSRLSDSIPILRSQVTFSANDVSIQEFLRGIANSTSLNLLVDPSLNIRMVNNFNNVRVCDLLAFICKQYNLSLSATGSIITIYKTPEVIAPVIKEPGIKVIPGTDTISLDYNNVPLYDVIREIADATGENIIISPGSENATVRIYIQFMPFEKALEKMAFANNLEMKKTPDGFYILQTPLSVDQPRKQEGNSGQSFNSGNDQNSNRNTNQGSRKNYYYDKQLDLKIISVDSISLYSPGSPLSDIVNALADKLKLDNIFLSQLDGNVVGRFTDQNLDELLNNLFRGSSYSYKKSGNSYIFGDKKLIELHEYRVIKLKHRTTVKITESLPTDLTKELEIKEYPELNSIVASGSTPKLDDLEEFIAQIDKNVPVILIEVMLVNVKKTFTVTTGISAGTGKPSQTSAQTVYPGLDYTMSPQSVNRLINSFNSFGSVNIGKVTSDFYLSIKALEDQGVLDVQSTPKLSTINGHEAVLTIGQTTYYKEEQSNLYGSLSTSITTMQTYKPVNADMTITIKPQVSEDEQITLDIEFKQSDFTDKIEPLAPPGTVTRNFKSSIRVKNEELVLLGGLEENSKNKSATGIPLLSRIPVLKWFFSNRVEATSKAKLSVFIKPTILK